VLFIKPEGSALSANQAKALDDEFFRFRPLAYFNARIAALLTAHEVTVRPSGAGLAPFRTVLGLSPEVDPLEFDDTERHLQVAADAVGLRHHAAETLLRFLHYLTASQPTEGDAPCAWLQIADGPKSIHNVVRDVVKSFKERDDLFASLFWPPETTDSEEVHAAGSIALDWINHAIYLLKSDELSAQVANNRMKHGLAISARNDLRVELITEPIPEGGEIPLSAFGQGKSIPIVDKPELTYLARPYGKPARGVEATSLQVSVPHVLAETWLMAVPYAAFFHIAARRHFAEVTDDFAPFPTLPVGPTPAQLRRGLVLGTRMTITTPPDPTTQPRPSGFFTSEFFQTVTFDFDGVRTATVVEG